MAAAQASASFDEGIGRDEQRTEEAGLPICGYHDLLRIHAGDRDGERSPHVLLSLSPGLSALRKYLNVNDVERQLSRASDAMSVGLTPRTGEADLSDLHV